jgi:citrate lyase beta subunit
MQVNALARPTRNRKPSLRKSAVIKDREDANAANAEKKARRNAMEAKKTAKGELVKRVNNLANLFSSVRVKSQRKNNA